MLGVITAHNYSAAHRRPTNKKYVEEFKKANGFRPNFISTGGWDGMQLIYEALKKTNGDTDGEKLIGAMKGMKWEARAGRSRSIRTRATSCRTSTSARSRR